MKKKRFLSAFISILMVFSPVLFSCMNVSAVNEGEVEVTLKSDDPAITKTYNLLVAEAKNNEDEVQGGELYTTEDKLYFKLLNEDEAAAIGMAKDDAQLAGWSAGEEDYYELGSILEVEDGQSYEFSAEWEAYPFKLTTKESKYTITKAGKQDTIGKFDVTNDIPDIASLPLQFTYTGGFLTSGSNKISYYATSEEDNTSTPNTVTMDIESGTSSKNVNLPIYVKDFSSMPAGDYTASIRYNWEFAEEPNADLPEEMETSGTGEITLKLSIPDEENSDDPENENNNKEEQKNEYKFPKTAGQEAAIPLIMIMAISFLMFLATILVAAKNKHSKNFTK